MKGILKGLFSLCISIIGIVSFCSAETIHLPTAFTTNVSSPSFSSSSRNSILTNTSKGDGKYFCYSDVYYNSSASNLSKLGELSIYFCNDTSPSTTVDLSTLDYCHLVKSGIVGTTNGTLYQSTGFNCTFMDFSNVNSKIYIALSREVVGSSVNATYSYTVAILGALANSTDYLNSFNLINKNNVDTNYCLNNNLCPICPTIDQNYCESNNLCPVCIYSGYENSLNACTNNLNICQSNLSSCLAGNYTGLSWSSLYINNIQHLGGPSIYLDIPEEINRDYQYSSNEDMYIDIEGYNVNYDSISGAIAIQNYKPDSSDLNKIITELVPLFIPGLVIILFLYFVFRFIKKIF